jgi:hypothetical protein
MLNDSMGIVRWALDKGHRVGALGGALGAGRGSRITGRWALGQGTDHCARGTGYWALNNRHGKLETGYWVGSTGHWPLCIGHWARTGKGHGHWEFEHGAIGTDTGQRTRITGH